MDESHEGNICTIYARIKATSINNLIRRLSRKSWRLDFEPVFNGWSADSMFGRRNARMDHWIILKQLWTRWHRISQQNTTKSYYILTFYSSNVTYFYSFSREAFVRCARKRGNKARKTEQTSSVKLLPLWASAVRCLFPLTTLNECLNDTFLIERLCSQLRRK